MFSPFARALAYYGGGGFALALFCAGVFFDPAAAADAANHEHVRRRSLVLALFGVIHPVIAATALLLARDANRASDPAETDTAVVVSSASLTASLAVMAGVFALVA